MTPSRSATRSTGALLAIDPGSEQSAYVLYERGEIIQKGIVGNRDMLGVICGVIEIDDVGDSHAACVIEMVASYGMAVGREIFETVFWAGRFAERWDVYARQPSSRLVRRDVKMHLCGNNTANDSNLRAALIDRFGPGKTKAIGVKSAPGPLYGVRKDEWAALALAVTFDDARRKRAAK